MHTKTHFKNMIKIAIAALAISGLHAQANAHNHEKKSGGKETRAEYAGKHHRAMLHGLSPEGAKHIKKVMKRSRPSKAEREAMVKAQEATIKAMEAYPFDAEKLAHAQAKERELMAKKREHSHATFAAAVAKLSKEDRAKLTANMRAAHAKRTHHKKAKKHDMKKHEKQGMKKEHHKDRKSH